LSGKFIKLEASLSLISIFHHLVLYEKRILLRFLIVCSVFSFNNLHFERELPEFHLCPKTAVPLGCSSDSVSCALEHVLYSKKRP